MRMPRKLRKPAKILVHTVSRKTSKTRHPPSADRQSIGSLSGTSVVDGYNYKTGQFDLSVYKPIVEALRQMKQDGSMLPGVESLDIDPLRAQFAAGKIGMYFNHSGEPAVYQSQFPTKINWNAALPPTIDGSQKGTVSVIAGNYIGISKSTANKDKAWKFLQYFTR